MRRNLLLLILLYIANLLCSITLLPGRSFVRSGSHVRPRVTAFGRCIASYNIAFTPSASLAAHSQMS